ncbi:alpha/beta hydrolase [Rhodoferax sp.]|uniref:alpha/beta hydrolase n=1 Tax=Rhodoferax sp. TaxID=50421 RepID=UPI00273177E2|nr:alpha/beta hydrolase [Rhodoferax sp.]MDP1529930.1 alpha/beta hydrolase [Rhodoferax sp.]MDP1942703.1 alpha/beta hydrolase [Rhodoferax sp.]MDP2443482.1 alpha/beta hydrolase [Rhodoferax sp.]MDZ4206269.1 alpha/beta hydrolase [Rhodoferax sp.]
MTTLYREFASQAQIDAQYNPAIKLPDPLVPAKHYIAQSALARQNLRCVLDVPYGPTLAETLDIFPADVPNAPVFVFLHGGYWRAFSSKEFSCVALGLQPLGITTVVVNYALCPFVSLDEITRQVRAAVAWTQRHIAAYGGDPARLALGGHSAGAHLTAMCLQTRWAEDYGLPPDPLAAAVLVSGVYDIAPLRYSYLQPMIQLDEGLIQRNSPMFGVRPCKTPIWVNWGSEETPEFARQASSFLAAWQDAGNAGELSALPGADHYIGIHGFEDPASSLSQWLATRLAL